MHRISYYSFQDAAPNSLKNCSSESTAQELILNCAGKVITPTPFVSENREGRLDYYYMYVSAGCLKIFTQNGVLSAGAGTVVLFEARKSYKYQYEGGKPLQYYWAHFTGSAVTERLHLYGLRSFEHLYEISPNNAVSAHFQSIFDTYSHYDTFRARELSIQLERLLIATARAIPGNDTAQNVLSKSLKYIGECYHSKIQIPTLAKMENLSVSRYNYLFKAQTGLSPTQYITRQRILSAKELLTSTDLSLKQIAVMCGYAEYHFFSRMFKKTVGISPREFRLRS